MPAYKLTKKQKLALAVTNDDYDDDYGDDEDKEDEMEFQDDNE